LIIDGEEDNGNIMEPLFIEISQNGIIELWKLHNHVLTRDI